MRLPLSKGGGGGILICSDEVRCVAATVVVFGVAMGLLIQRFLTDDDRSCLLPFLQAAIMKELKLESVEERSKRAA